MKLNSKNPSSETSKFDDKLYSETGDEENCFITSQSVTDANNSESLSDLDREIAKFYKFLDSDSPIEDILYNQDLSEESSCNDSGLDAEMEKFYKLLNSESTANENTLTNQSSSVECKQLVESLKMKQSNEVNDCNIMNEIIINNANQGQIQSNVSPLEDSPPCDKVAEKDSNRALICSSSDFDAIVGEIISDNINDIISDTSKSIAETKLIETEIDEISQPLCVGNSGLHESVPIKAEQNDIESITDFSENDENGTLILCCESDLDDLDDTSIDNISSYDNKDVSADTLNSKPIKQEMNEISDTPILGYSNLNESVSIKTEQNKADPIKNFKSEACKSQNKPIKQEINEIFEPPIQGNSNLKESVPIKTEQNMADPIKNFKSEACKSQNKPIKQEIEIFEPPIQGNSNHKESVSNKTEHNKTNPAKDFYDKEKHDIIDPRWQQVKELSTNEERYQQVKSCWQSTTIPDPDKNLSFHSFRKRQLKKSASRPIRQHKRQASTKLSGSEAKRSRPCTYMFDFKIDSINKEKKEEEKKIQKEMKAKLSDIERQHCKKKVSVQTHSADFNNFHDTKFKSSLLVNLQQAHKRQIACVKDEYQRKASRTEEKYQNGLECLNNVRNEVLQFYSFYKGLSANTVRDPTILSDSKLQELDDIEHFYMQMDKCYT